MVVIVKNTIPEIQRQLMLLAVCRIFRRIEFLTHTSDHTGFQYIQQVTITFCGFQATARGFPSSSTATMINTASVTLSRDCSECLRVQASILSVIEVRPTFSMRV